MQLKFANKWMNQGQQWPKNFRKTKTAAGVCSAQIVCVEMTLGGTDARLALAQ